jgi:hypothetical protein
MIYIDKYTYTQLQIHNVHILVRQQLQHTVKSKTAKKETRPFSHSWYYQPRLKGVGAGIGMPPFCLGSYHEPGLKDPFSQSWFTRD